jgi:hypothetical protein
MPGRRALGFLADQESLPSSLDEPEADDDPD